MITILEVQKAHQTEFLRF